MVHNEHDVVMIGGSHALHRHEKLAIALSKAMRGHSLQETKKDGSFHVHTKTYLDGAILKEVCSYLLFCFGPLHELLLFEVNDVLVCIMYGEKESI